MAIVYTVIVQSAWSGVISVQLDANTYSFSENSKGEMSIHMDGFGSINQSGYPQLPSKVFGIQLPAGSRVIDVNIKPREKSLLPGSYNIACALPMLASDDDVSIQESYNEFERGKQTFTESDSYYPEQNGVFVGVDYYFKYPVVKVRYEPFSYHPAGHLIFVKQIQVQIFYTEEDPGKPLRDSEMKGHAEDAFENRLESNINTGLVIVSSRNLAGACGPFVRWKKWLGYSVQHIYIEDIEITYPGADATEKLRNCLIELSKNEIYRYVLLIGHLDRIPMKTLYPDPNNHSSDGAVPSDYYYAELTGSWDSDGDGFFGEFNEDAVDWSPELNIGRIPWNDADVVSDILDRMIQYEKDTGDWKSRALLLGAMSNYPNEKNLSMYQTKTDGAELMEALKSDVFQDMGTSSLYEKEGVSSSDFDCDQPLNHETLFNNWSSGSYGCVAWWSHSNYKRLTRKWWETDDGDNIPESSELQKEDLISVSDFPVAQQSPIVFANSCDVGWPEKVSLGREMIRSSVSGIVSSSRLSYYVMGWDEVSDGGNASLAYYFWQELVSQTKTAGEAAYHSKWQYLSQFHQSWQQYHNIYTFNYYGDPTLSLSNQYPVFGGLSGTVSLEPTEGITGTVSVDIPQIGFHTDTDQSGEYMFEVLVPGIYTVIFYAKGMESFDAIIEVKAGKMATLNASLSVLKEPKMLLSESKINLPLQEGFSGQSVLVITNSGNSNLIYHGSQSNSPFYWLKLDSTEHVIEPEKSDSLLIQFQTLDLDQGCYESVIRFSTNDPDQPEFQFPITMDVLDTIAPGPIQDLSLSITGKDSICLEWTAPGDNGLYGQAGSYEIWYSNRPMETLSLETSELKMENLVPKPPGSKESIILKCTEDLSGAFYVRVLDEAGLCSCSNAVSVELSAVNESSYKPENMILQNFPNPFNAYTEIRFSIAEQGRVSIDIFNAAGQKVKTLLDANREAGEYHLRWDSTDDYYRPVSSGFYFYQIRAPGFVANKKMLLLK